MSALGYELRRFYDNSDNMPPSCYAPVFFFTPLLLKIPRLQVNFFKLCDTLISNLTKPSKAKIIILILMLTLSYAPFTDKRV